MVAGTCLLWLPTLLDSLCGSPELLRFAVTTFIASSNSQLVENFPAAWDCELWIYLR